ncbi:MAG TPA: hypothetical protein VGG23_00390 [Acidimicrobiales bacterium]
MTSRRHKDSGKWRVHFFRRHQEDDPSESVPTIDYSETLSTSAVAEINAVLDAVANAPPPTFSGGGKWEVMGRDMAGFFEVRVTGNNKGGQRMNHRLFCLLVRDASDLGGSSIVCIGGLSKPPRTAARPREYQQIKRFADEFRRRRTVME